MFTSLHHTKSPKYLFLISFLLIFLIGCQPTITSMPTSTPKPPFSFLFRIQQQNSYEPIEMVEVSLDIQGQLPITVRSDHEGIAILEVDARQAGRNGYLIVEKDGYQSYTKNVTIQEDQLPTLILLDSQRTSIAIIETATAVPTEPPQPTDVQPTDTAVLPTNTVQPASTTTPTHTPSPTATNTPAPVGQIIAQVTETAQDTWVYTGPGNANLRLGSMRIDETGVVLGKDKWNGWYKVRTSSNVEGWVDITHLTLIQGSHGDVAVIWPSADDTLGSSSTNSTDLPTGGGSSSQCAVVTLDFREWPNEKFDDITVSWTNVPPNTAYFIFAANGTLNGEEAPLIYPTQVNVEEEYLIGLWKFTERGFTSSGTFSYALQAKTSSGTTICTTTGTFTQ